MKRIVRVVGLNRPYLWGWGYRAECSGCGWKSLIYKPRTVGMAVTAGRKHMARGHSHWALMHAVDNLHKEARP